MKRILIPFDFSTEAGYALQLGTQIAEESDSSLTLMNVIEHPTPSSFKTMGVENYDPMENVYITKLIEKVKSGMEEIMDNEAYDEIDLSYKIVLGNPFNELTEEIDTGDFDLVIMGTTGADGLEEFFVGSNAEKIVRHAKCPVITLRNQVDIDDVEQIVFATDMDRTTDKFISELTKLQEFFDAQLRLVRINTPANFSSSREDLVRMKQFANSYKLNNYTLDIYNHVTEEEGIIHFAEDIDAGIIAMGTHQRTGLNHFFNDSLAEEVVNHAARPVWTFKLDA
ncbi:MAG: universal stress protein [Cyclobacteriaceae bacterium]